MIKLVRNNHEAAVPDYTVLYENGIQLGDMTMKEDGYYDFWPIMRAGYWPSSMLHAIADKLDELNQDWDQQVRETLHVN